MAGGGVKKGFVYGATDEFGYYAVETVPPDGCFGQGGGEDHRMMRRGEDKAKNFVYSFLDFQRVSCLRGRGCWSLGSAWGGANGS
jgi:hypothetical protein